MPNASAVREPFSDRMIVTANAKNAYKVPSFLEPISSMVALFNFTIASAIRYPENIHGNSSDCVVITPLEKPTHTIIKMSVHADDFFA